MVDSLIAEGFSRHGVILTNPANTHPWVNMAIQYDSATPYQPSAIHAPRGGARSSPHIYCLLRLRWWGKVSYETRNRRLSGQFLCGQVGQNSWVECSFGTTFLAGGRALIAKKAFVWPTLCGFFTKGGAVLLSFFLISIFLFSKFREFQAGAWRGGCL